MVVVEVFVGNRMVLEGDKEEAHNRGVLLGWSGCTALMLIFITISSSSKELTHFAQK